MATISSVSDPNGSGRKWVVAVKGAPETLKDMYVKVPEGYDDTYRWFTRRGSRVLALGMKEMHLQPEKVCWPSATPGIGTHSQVNTTPRDHVECDLHFAGFLVFHTPLKSDAVATLKMLNDSSHRVRRDQSLRTLQLICSAS